MNYMFQRTGGRSILRTEADAGATCVDDRIAQAVQTRMFDLHVESLANIEVTVAARMVRLSGEVQTSEHRQMAIAAAMDVPGVDGVFSEIVTPGPMV